MSEATLNVPEAEKRARALLAYPDDEEIVKAQDFLALVALVRRQSTLLRLVLTGEHTDEMVEEALAEAREAGLGKEEECESVVTHDGRKGCAIHDQPWPCRKEER